MYTLELFPYFGQNADCARTCDQPFYVYRGFEPVTALTHCCFGNPISNFPRQQTLFICYSQEHTFLPKSLQPFAHIASLLLKYWIWNCSHPTSQLAQALTGPTLRYFRKTKYEWMTGRRGWARESGRGGMSWCCSFLRPTWTRLGLKILTITLVVYLSVCLWDE